MKRQTMIAMGPLLITGFLLVPTFVAAQESQAVYEGFTHPRYDIMVAATEIGRIKAVTVEEGDRVSAGDIIAGLEDSIQQASVRIAELQASMRGEVEAAEAELKHSEARASQVRVLAQENAARPDELLRAEADVEAAAARHKAAIEQTQLRALELERFQLQLDRRKVRVPMSGVIAKVYHQPGEYITPGDPAVARLLVTDQLYAVFNVPTEDIATMKVGDEVGVFLRSQSKTIPTKIYAFAPLIDGESGTLEVRVILANADGKLRAGDLCTMQMGTTHRRSASLPQLPAPPANQRLPKLKAAGQSIR